MRILGPLQPTSGTVSRYIPAKRSGDGTAFIQGATIVQEALDGSWPIEALFLLDGTVELSEHSALLAKAKERGVSVYTLTDKAMARLSSVEKAPPVAVVVRAPESDLATGFKLPQRLLVLDRISDPGNVGTLIRTAFAFGYTSILTSGSVNLSNEKMLRATAGVAFRTGAVLGTVPVEQLATLLRKQGAALRLLDSAAKAPLSAAPKPAKNQVLALILGNESAGVDRYLWADAWGGCIPMESGVESLNVSVAGAIALYEFRAGRATL